VVVALSGYVVIVVAGRALDTADYERFTVYWGLFFTCTGILDGLLHETTRAVAARRVSGATVIPAGPGKPARPLHVAAQAALATATLGLVASLLPVPTITRDPGGTGTVLFALGLASYTVQAAVCGILSATGRWRAYARLIGVDSAVRVVLAVAAWAAGLQLTAFLLVTVIGAVSWTGILFTGRSGVRTLTQAVADVTTGRFLRRTGTAMLASGAGALLITGFPVLLTATSGDAAPGSLAALITAVTLTRAPLLVPLQRFTPALIVHFARRKDRPVRALWRPLAACAGAAAGGGLLALWTGVPLASLFLPPELVTGAGVYAVLTCASGALAVLTVTGTSVLTREQHGAYLAGWAVATVTAVALLLTVADPVTGTALALGVAPLAGAVVHLAAPALIPSRIRPS